MGWSAPLLGAFASPLVLDVTDREPKELDDSLIVGKVPSVLGDLAQLVVQ